MAESILPGHSARGGEQEVGLTRSEPTIGNQIGAHCVVGKTFHYPDGRIHTFQTFAPEHSHEVAVVAVTPEAKIIIAEQFRPGPEVVMQQLPGGGFEADKDRGMDDAAKRELREETGYLPGTLEFIGRCIRSAYSNATSHYFLATDCTLSPEGTAHDPYELINVRLIGIPELFDNALEGHMTDIAGVHFARSRLIKIAREHGIDIQKYVEV